MEEPSKTNNLSIPIAIVIAGILIAGAIYMGTSSKAGIAENQQPQVAEQRQSGDLEQMAAITSQDHIRGNPNAPVTIVEYSDYECPFCKSFHPTMQRIVDEYGDKVAWVYRHFPLDSIHSQARTEAVAAECAAELGGNDAFWKYTDRFFEVTPSNNRTDIATVLPQIAREIGLNEQQFTACLGSGKYDDHIQANLENGVATGGNGTPWSIVMTASGKKYPLSGAQPYEAVKQLVDLAFQEN